ncbi:MAG: LysM peptidoglycan-binding domain-containing protein [Dehalobacterium sp.]
MKFYFVKPGDTLSSIASLYDTIVEEILQINDIENPDLIYPNQAILVPKSARLCPFPLKEAVSKREEVVEVVNKIESMNRNCNSDLVYLNHPLLVPAVESPQLVQAARTPPPPQVSTKNYVVQPEDTLFKIAQNFGTTVGTLVSLNKITDPDLLYPGTEILVPVPEITT